jgi:hypothetical protein
MAVDTSAYSSFSGIDILAVVADTVIATLQGVSYSVTREKAPVYTFGSANPRSFSRGKRGLAGSMIFTLFDRSALYQIMRDTSGRFDYYAHIHEPATIDTNVSVWDWAQAYQKDLTSGTGIQTIKRHAEYADQIMPFNITLIAQNEYGLSAWMSIVGVEILNEGGGLSVDDITNEEQMTYVAKAKTAWVPWMPDGDKNINATTGNFYTGMGANASGTSTIFPFPSGGTVDQYINWAGLSGQTGV